MNWVKYGKSYYHLRRELSQKGESIVGVQVVAELSERYPSFAGLLLVGHIESGSTVDGERFEEIDDIIILRYRRLLTAEQLEETE